MITDSFMYCSAPAIRNASLHCEEVNTSKLTDTNAETKTKCQTKINIPQSCILTQYMNIQWAAVAGIEVSGRIRSNPTGLW